MKILFLEDDPVQVRLVSSILSPFYSVRAVRTIERAEYCFCTYAYDLFIVDISVVDGDGKSFCQYLRENGSKSPILMLTASAHLEDKIESFQLGADDYVTKPFHNSELLARVRALARRAQLNYNGEMLTLGDLRLDTVEKMVYRSNQPLELRPKEFALLEFLLRNRGKVISRSVILDHLWEDTQETLSNTVDVHVKNIREVIDRPFGTHTITTVRGFGYKLS